MNFLAFTALDFFFYLAMVAFIFVSVILILIVLIQKGRGGGLSGAFGGGGGGNTAFGAKTGDVLTWATSIIFGVFLVLAVTMNLLADRINSRTPTAAVSAAPVPAAPIQSPIAPASEQPTTATSEQPAPATAASSDISKPINRPSLTPLVPTTLSTTKP